MSSFRRDFSQKIHRSRHSLTLVALILITLFIGVTMVYNASVAEGIREYNNKYHFAIQQLKWVGLGLFVMLFVSQIPTSIIKKFAGPFFLLCLILMIAVIIPGIGTKVQGARRWINIGFNLQPSELMKLGIILYLSTWLENPKPLTSFLGVIGLILGLTMLQPDLGTTIILATVAFSVYYLSGAPLSRLIPFIMIASLFFSIFIFSSPYRLNRLKTFLDPTQDTLGISYHINQVLLALGSGSWTGVGLGRSRQKHQYLPEATTDSIFAVIGEELGFLGGVVLISLLTFIIITAFKIAHQSSDRFSQLMAGGIASWLAIQIWLNIAAMVALVPLTGVPLPFISYGGSSLIAIMTGVGLILGVSRHSR